MSSVNIKGNGRDLSLRTHSKYHNMTGVEESKAIVIGACVVNNGVGQTSWSTNINSLNFQPDTCVVRQILYDTTNGTPDNSQYLLWSDIVSGGHIIGSFPGTASNSYPQSMFTVNKPMNTIAFQIFQVTATNGTEQAAGMIAEDVTAFLTITLEFTKHTSYYPFESKE